MQNISELPLAMVSAGKPTLKMFNNALQFIKRNTQANNQTIKETAFNTYFRP